MKPIPFLVALLLSLCFADTQIQKRGLGGIKIVPITTTTSTVRPLPTRRPVRPRPVTRTTIVGPVRMEEDFVMWVLYNRNIDMNIPGANVALESLFPQAAYFTMEDEQEWDAVVGPVISQNGQSVSWFRMKTNSPSRENYEQRIREVSMI